MAAFPVLPAALAVIMLLSASKLSTLYASSSATDSSSDTADLGVGATVLTTVGAGTGTATRARMCRSSTPSSLSLSSYRTRYVPSALHSWMRPGYHVTSRPYCASTKSPTLYLYVTAAAFVVATVTADLDDAATLGAADDLGGTGAALKASSSSLVNASGISSSTIDSSSSSLPASSAAGTADAYPNDRTEYIGAVDGLGATTGAAAAAAGAVLARASGCSQWSTQHQQHDSVSHHTCSSHAHSRTH